MGIGDELMAAGEAHHLHLRHGGGKISILDKNENRRWVPLWERMPWIARPGETAVSAVKNGPGARPYIAGGDRSKWQWRAYSPRPCPIAFTPEELAFGALYANVIALAPTIKKSASPNKQWPWERWQKLAYRFAGEGQRVVQLADSEAQPRLAGIEMVVCKTIWHAAAIINDAKLLVCHEGALHHFAAGLRARSIVIMGGYISPEQTGYKDVIAQTYLTAGKLPCGARRPCMHCHNAMQSITVEAVMAAANR